MNTVRALPSTRLLRGRTHRAAGIEAHRGGAARGKKRYVFATVSALRARKFLINWCARRDCSRLRRSSSASLRTAVADAPASNFGLRPGCRTPRPLPAGSRDSQCTRELKRGARFGAPFLIHVVRPERFELPASWFVARRSIQLSYGRKEDTDNSSLARR